MNSKDIGIYALAELELFPALGNVVGTIEPLVGSGDDAVLLVLGRDQDANAVFKGRNDLCLSGLRGRGLAPFVVRLSFGGPSLTNRCSFGCR